MEGSIQGTEINPNSQEIKKDLLNDLSRIEAENNEGAPKEIPNIDTPKPFVCPDRLLNVSQKFPTALQKVILCSNLTRDQKKAVESLFEAGKDELEINRAIMRRLIESLCTKIPALQSVINEDAILVMQWCLTMNERSKQMEIILEQQGVKQ